MSRLWGYDITPITHSRGFLTPTSSGDIIFRVKTVASEDGGETCGPFWFSFDTEEYALRFKQEINSKMEPTIIGEEENE